MAAPMFLNNCLFIKHLTLWEFIITMYKKKKSLLTFIDYICTSPDDDPCIESKHAA